MQSEIRYNGLNRAHRFYSKLYLSEEEQKRVEQILQELKIIYQASTVSLGTDMYATEDYIDVTITLSGVPNYTKGFSENI